MPVWYSYVKPCPEGQSHRCLQLGSEVQTDPAIALGLIGLEQTPACRTRAIRLLDNGENAGTRITTGCVVRAGAFADAQVIDTK